MRQSLRDRKKAATRLAISDIATRLFSEHGYEQVTLAQVAAAADVSVKTIFNYFNSKEELYFDRIGEVFDAIAAAIDSRPEGTTVLGALHEMFADRFIPFAPGSWSMVRSPAQLRRFRDFTAVEHAAPALRARRLVIADEWSDRLGRLLADELGIDFSDPRAQALAAMVMAAMSLRHRVVSDAVMARVPPDELERRVRAVVDEAFARLEAAFGDLDRAAGAAEPQAG